MKTIAFFNSKSGIGKTTLVYHLAWMYADLGLNVVVADLDPKANLTSLFLDEERLEELWLDGAHPQSILGTISPILEGNGDLTELQLEPITENLGLVVGDSELFIFESQLSEAWTRCYEGNELTFRTLSAFYRALFAAFQQQKADVVLIDVSPSLSAINTAALIAAEYVVIPLVQNPLFMYGLNNLGRSLLRLREKWQKCLNKKSVVDIDLPTAQMQPIGYVILQPHPPTNNTRWVDIPRVYRQSILNDNIETPPSVTQDNYCLATLPYYPGLIEMAIQAHKPIFHLKPADGAMGTYALAVKDCYKEFKQLAINLAKTCAIDFQKNNFAA